MNLTTTRKAIHDALCWGWMQKQSGIVEYLTYLARIDKSAKPSNSDLDLVEAAYIIAGINKLEPHIGGWLKFCYGPEHSLVIHGSLSSKLRFDLFPISSVKKHQRYLALASTAVEDYKLRQWQKRNLPDALYAARMDVYPSNFRRDWGRSLNQCLNKISAWDADGVGRISAVVKAMKGEAERGGMAVGPTVVLEEISS